MGIALNQGLTGRRKIMLLCTQDQQSRGNDAYLIGINLPHQLLYHKVADGPHAYGFGYISMRFENTSIENRWHLLDDRINKEERGVIFLQGIGKFFTD